jgi:hypothetical protein
MEKGMELELWFIIIKEFTKANGNVIISMVKVIRNFLMSPFFKECTSMENQKELVDILGLTDNFTKVNGSTD